MKHDMQKVTHGAQNKTNRALKQNMKTLTVKPTKQQ